MSDEVDPSEWDVPPTRYESLQVSILKWQRFALIALLLAAVTALIVTLVFLARVNSRVTAQTSASARTSVAELVPTTVAAVDPEIVRIAARRQAVACVNKTLMENHPRTGLTLMQEVGVDDIFARNTPAGPLRQRRLEHAKQEHEELMERIEKCKK